MVDSPTRTSLGYSVDGLNLCQAACDLVKTPQLSDHPLDCIVKMCISYRASHYGQEARAVSPADSQVEDLKDDLDRHRTRAQDRAQDTYQEGKEKSQNWWNKLFGKRLFLFLASY